MQQVFENAVRFADMDEAEIELIWGGETDDGSLNRGCIPEGERGVMTSPTKED